MMKTSKIKAISARLTTNLTHPPAPSLSVYSEGRGVFPNDIVLSGIRYSKRKKRDCFSPSPFTERGKGGEVGSDGASANKVDIDQSSKKKRGMGQVLIEDEHPRKNAG